MLHRNLFIFFLIVFSMIVSVASADVGTARGKSLSGMCVDCHGDNGLGDEDIPAIAGLESAYIRDALLNFKSGSRIDENEDMAEIAPMLTDRDIADLATYYSMLPGK